MSEELITDVKDPRRAESSETLWSGLIVSLVEDQVSLADGTVPVCRQYFVHPGAAAVVGLRGEPGSEEIVLVQQYRHPAGARLWEIPAGLLDVEGEDPLEAGKRELAEEVDLEADTWHVLVDIFNSPGGTTESLRIFLARDLHPVPVAFEREDEEAEMVPTWVSLDEAVRAVMEGRIHNASSVAGILAAHHARARNWEGLREANAPWFR